MKNILKNKKFQWGLATYLLIGSLYMAYDVFMKSLENSLNLFSFSQMVHYMFATITWFPIYILQDFGLLNMKFYWTSMNDITLLILGTYLFTHYIIIPIKHKIHLTKNQSNTIIHSFLILFAIIISLFTIPTFNYDINEIYKNYNYQHMFEHYTETAKKNEEVNQGIFEGFDVQVQTPTDTEILRIYFVNDYYSSNYDQEYRDDENKSFWGLARYGNNDLYINYDDIYAYTLNDSRRNKNNQTINITEDLYLFEIEQTFIHELGHHLDNWGMLKNQLEVYGFEDDSKVDFKTQQKYLDLYEKYKDELGYYGNYVNFEEKLFNREDGFYTSGDYSNEIVTRVNTLCFRLDPEKNYNEVKLMDWGYCQEFDFPESYKTNYDKVLKLIIKDYVDTFITGYDEPITKDWKNEIVNDICSIKCSVNDDGYDYVKQIPDFMCYEECKIELKDRTYPTEE